MDDPTDQPDDELDGELDDLDDDYEDDDDVEPAAGRGTGKRTPRPPGPIDKRVAAVAQTICNQKGWSYQDLADRIVPAHQGETWNKSRAQRFLNARKRVTITELADILRALDVPAQWFYAEADVIAAPDNTAGWIEADVSLDAEDRRALLRQYQLARAAKRSNGT